jgi:hypothetical protein
MQRARIQFYVWLAMTLAVTAAVWAWIISLN